MDDLLDSTISEGSTRQPFPMELKVRTNALPTLIFHCDRWVRVLRMPTQPARFASDAVGVWNPSPRISSSTRIRFLPSGRKFGLCDAFLVSWTKRAAMKSEGW
jgi:hypothetical protein